MDYVKCPACMGRKKVIGMGGLERNCNECKGIGFIDKPVTVLVEPVSNSISSSSNIIDLTVDVARREQSVADTLKTIDTTVKKKRAVIKRKIKKIKSQPLRKRKSRLKPSDAEVLVSSEG